MPSRRVRLFKPTNLRSRPVPINPTPTPQRPEQSSLSHAHHQTPDDAGSKTKRRPRRLVRLSQIQNTQSAHLPSHPSKPPLPPNRMTPIAAAAASKRRLPPLAPSIPPCPKPVAMTAPPSPDLHGAQCQRKDDDDDTAVAARQLHSTPAIDDSADVNLRQIDQTQSATPPAAEKPAANNAAKKRAITALKCPRQTTHSSMPPDTSTSGADGSAASDDSDSPFEHDSDSSDDSEQLRLDSRRKRRRVLESPPSEQEQPPPPTTVPAGKAVHQHTSATAVSIVGRDGATFAEALQKLDQIAPARRRRGRPSKQDLLERRRYTKLRERLQAEMQRLIDQQCVHNCAQLTGTRPKNAQGYAGKTVRFPPPKLVGPQSLRGGALQAASSGRVKKRLVLSTKQSKSSRGGKASHPRFGRKGPAAWMRVAGKAAQIANMPYSEYTARGAKVGKGRKNALSPSQTPESFDENEDSASDDGGMTAGLQAMDNSPESLSMGEDESEGQEESDRPGSVALQERQIEQLRAELANTKRRLARETVRVSNLEEALGVNVDLDCPSREQYDELARRLKAREKDLAESDVKFAQKNAKLEVVLAQLRTLQQHVVSEVSKRNFCQSCQDREGSLSSSLDLQIDRLANILNEGKESINKLQNCVEKQDLFVGTLADAILDLQRQISMLKAHNAAEKRSSPVSDLS